MSLAVDFLDMHMDMLVVHAEYSDIYRTVLFSNVTHAVSDKKAKIIQQLKSTREGRLV